MLFLVFDMGPRSCFSNLFDLKLVERYMLIAFHAALSESKTYIFFY